MNPKKLIITLLILLLIAVLVFFNLPLEKRRAHDIRFGNKLIVNIENYQSRFGHLPRNWDWKTLEELGFKINRIGTEPDYIRINDNEYQLTFLDSFDGPYLLYNSTEKKWKKDFPKMPEKEETDLPLASGTTTNELSLLTDEVMEAAEDAILISIENMQKPEIERELNFPTDKYNVPFTLKEKKEFKIRSCTFIKDTDICVIGFLPVEEDIFGLKFMVEFDLKNKKALSVYMQADS